MYVSSKCCRKPARWISHTQLRSKCRFTERALAAIVRLVSFLSMTYIFQPTSSFFSLIFCYNKTIRACHFRS
ncbi:hypothetical protein BCR43DRAFT_498301, partial [Syncephalastrum racemosum]